MKIPKKPCQYCGYPFVTNMLNKHEKQCQKMPDIDTLKSMMEDSASMRHLANKIEGVSHQFLRLQLKRLKIDFSNRGLCKKCKCVFKTSTFASHKRFCRKVPPPDELKKIMQDLQFRGVSEMAEFYNVSHTTLTAHLERLKLKFPKKWGVCVVCHIEGRLVKSKEGWVCDPIWGKVCAPLPDTWEADIIDKGMTHKELCVKWKMTAAVLTRVLKANGIKLPKKDRRRKYLKLKRESNNGVTRCQCGFILSSESTNKIIAMSQTATDLFSIANRVRKICPFCAFSSEQFRTPTTYYTSPTAVEWGTMP